MFIYITPYTFLIFLFFFNDTATTEIYTLSLHDALPICGQDRDRKIDDGGQERRVGLLDVRRRGRGEEAGADAARLASGHRVERRLGRHGERVLVVVGHGALAAGAPAPHLSERLA